MRFNKCKTLATLLQMCRKKLNLTDTAFRIKGKMETFGTLSFLEKIDRLIKLYVNNELKMLEMV